MRASTAVLPGSRVAWRASLAACCCAVVVLLSAAPAPGQAVGSMGAMGGGFTRTVPTSTYFATLGVFYDGDYRAALIDFLSEGRGGIKNGQTSWIDSICYNTMAGESYYQLGQYGPALNHYTNALNLYVAFNNWMLRVQFDPVIRPAGAARSRWFPGAARNESSASVRTKTPRSSPRARSTTTWP